MEPTETTDVVETVEVAVDAETPEETVVETVEPETE